MWTRSSTSTTLTGTPASASHEQLRERVAENLATRSMHHHVFDTRSAWAMIVETGWSPLAVEAVWPHDIVILARNGGTPTPLGRFRSPFPHDRSCNGAGATTSSMPPASLRLR